MLPDDVLSRIYNEEVFKLTTATYRKVGVSNSLVANEFCDPLKSGALHNHFQNVIIVSEEIQSQENKKGVH